MKKNKKKKLIERMIKDYLDNLNQNEGRVIVKGFVYSKKDIRTDEDTN